MSAEDIESIIEPYIDEIFINGRIASKHASVWKKLSAESNGAKGAKGFYSHVIDNRNNIQRKFSNPESNNILIFNETTEISDITVASTVVDSSINPNIETVSINFTHREFNDLVQFLPHLADRLVKDIGWLPLWSCVCRDVFGYGRVPASSAPVGSDFNDVKTRCFATGSLPLRADEVIVKHTNYLSVKLKIVDAAVVDTAIGNDAIRTETTTEINPKN